MASIAPSSMKFINYKPEMIAHLSKYFTMLDQELGLNISHLTIKEMKIQLQKELASK
jgi:hypothetical protein